MLERKYKYIKVDQNADGITYVTLNRPEKRNAMSPALNEEMNATLEALATDDRCRVLVLTGAGDAFTAGMDLKEYFRDHDDAPDTMVLRVRRTTEQWHWRRLRDYPDRKSTRLNSSHVSESRMPSSA